MSASVSALWLFYLCCYLPTLIGGTVGQEQGSGITKVVVEEGTDAVLPCTPSTKESIVAKIFDWKKDGQKDVFMYDSGDSKANRGQDKQFKGRVSHFPDELMNGNASIEIQNTKVTDSGIYSCIFPRLQPRQTFNIELVVGQILKDRSGETPGASKPFITTLDETKDWSLLQCEVRGASPEPKVEWQDSSGNILPAEEPQVSERGGRYYVTLKTTVTKTGRYRCEVTQEEISHQSYSETFVFISEAAPAPEPNIRILNATVDWSLLQCEVRDASPKPKVEWQDSSGNILPAEQHVSERGGRHYVSIITTVTKTGRYRCDVTQREISHHIYAETHVFISEKPSSVSEKLREDCSTREITGWLFGGFVLGAAVLAAVQALLVATKRITVTCNQGPCWQRGDYEAPPEKQPDLPL